MRDKSSILILVYTPPRPSMDTYDVWLEKGLDQLLWHYIHYLSNPLYTQLIQTLFEEHIVA